MQMDGIRAHSARFGASVRWLGCGVLLVAVMASHAYANVITDSLVGFPPDLFMQQDKTWGGWTDLTGNLPSGFTTLITTRPNILTDRDLHTFTLSAAFLPDTTYVVSYYVVINIANVGIIKAGTGLVQRVGGTTITTVLTNVPFSLYATSTSMGLITIPAASWSLLNVTDTIKTRSESDMSRFSNSFLEQLPVPEPGAAGMLATGVLALAGLVKRRNSK